MHALVARLLLIASLVMMPLGMVPAPAAATPASDHMAMQAPDHCADMGEEDDDEAGMVDCKATCMALRHAAFRLPKAKSLPSPALTDRPLSAHSLHEPEILAPPPRA